MSETLKLKDIKASHQPKQNELDVTKLVSLMQIRVSRWCLYQHQRETGQKLLRCEHSAAAEQLLMQPTDCRFWAAK